VGVTALAGMAILASGTLPGRGPYGEPLSRAIDYLLRQVNDFGFISANQSRMYSHAFATLFLAEVYGMVQDERLEPSLEEAVGLIVRCQNEEGAWRYEPFVWQSDMSVTVCQLMALRAARNAGILVPQSTIDAAVAYVNASMITEENPVDRYGWSRRRDPNYFSDDFGAFRYQVRGDERSSFALTAAGVTSLMHTAQYDHARLRDSLRALAKAQKQVSDHWSPHFFYFYGHYYAVQAMFLSGTGADRDQTFWNEYWRITSKELVDHQQADGRWVNSVGPGDAFATAVACIVLQAPNRYLPILQR